MSAISNPSRFIDYSLDVRRNPEEDEKQENEPTCGYCLQKDDEFRDSQINRGALPNLRNRGIEHLRDGKVCSRTHAACLRAAGQIAAAQNMQRPLSCPTCLHEITSVNGMPIGQYLNLEHLPGPHLAEQVGEADEEFIPQGVGEEAPLPEGPQVEGNNDAHRMGRFEQLDLMFEDIIDVLRAMERVRGRDQNLGQLYHGAYVSAKRGVPIQEILSHLRGFRDRELVVAIRGALHGAVDARNMDLLRALLRDNVIKQNISLEMRGEAIANTLHRHLPANPLRAREMLDLLLPTDGKKIPDAPLGKAVCEAVKKRSDEFVDLLLRHGQIGDYYRGKALREAIKAIDYSLRDEREQGVRSVDLLLANGHIPDLFFKSALKNAISSDRVDIRIVRDLLALRELSPEEKKEVLEQAIDANRRDLVQDLSRDLTFRQRSSALRFVLKSESVRNSNRFKAPFDRGIYSTLADLKIKSAFYGAIGFSVAYLIRQAYRVNFK